MNSRRFIRQSWNLRLSPMQAWEDARAHGLKMTFREVECLYRSFEWNLDHAAV